MKYDKNITEQDIVDEYAMNINKALEKANTLKEIETDNKFDKMFVEEIYLLIFCKRKRCFTSKYC